MLKLLERRLADFRRQTLPLRIRIRERRAAHHSPVSPSPTTTPPQPSRLENLHLNRLGSLRDAHGLPATDPGEGIEEESSASSSIHAVLDGAPAGALLEDADRVVVAADAVVRVVVASRYARVGEDADRRLLHSRRNRHLAATDGHALSMHDGRNNTCVRRLHTIEPRQNTAAGGRGCRGFGGAALDVGGAGAEAGRGGAGA